MDENITWYRNTQVERTIKNLAKSNIDSFFVQNEAELREMVKNLVPTGSKVAVGDSMTLFDTGIIDLLRSENYNFLDKYESTLTTESKKALYRETFTADSFLCSTNAITENGELYNIDGNGSRVAAMLYGPSQVIIVAGINKIVKNLAEAEIRVRNYAAPLDAKRLGKNTPCATLGYCVDCQSNERICNDFVIIKRQFIKGRIKVIFVNKTLGY